MQDKSTCTKWYYEDFWDKTWSEFLGNSTYCETKHQEFCWKTKSHQTLMLGLMNLDMISRLETNTINWAKRDQNFDERDERTKMRKENP